MTTVQQTSLDRRVRKALERKGLTTPTALANALATVNHQTDASQALRWLRRETTPRAEAMKAIAEVLELPATVVASWFMEARL
jgi:transcriptional regulator with XRE-family HTH domain